MVRLCFFIGVDLRSAVFTDDVCDSGPIVSIPAHEIRNYNGACTFWFFCKKVCGKVRDGDGNKVFSAPVKMIANNGNTLD